MIVGGRGEQPRVIDPSIESGVSIFQVAGDVAIYTTEESGSSQIRTARLDGSRVAKIYTIDLAQLIVSAVTPDGRLVFTVPNIGDPDQVSGGTLYSARLDGSDPQRIGSGISTADGTVVKPVDQDFEAITPSGRLVIEAEFRAVGVGSQLVLATSDAAASRLLTQATAVRFAGLIP
jgi:hypothetical protein